MVFLQDEKENDTRDTDRLHEGSMHTKLVNNLEALLATARPRLAHIAHTYGVPLDGVDDIVQETLVEAWQHLASLRTPERFDAWLNGICRHVSLHWMRVQGTTERRQRPFSSLLSGEEETDRAMLEPVDSQMLDLAEELNRQDLAVLLDRAMGYLPVSTRKALELHYLAEMPQREVALRLGMTINALEVKLHRARRQLREILNGPLRTDAASFGLALEQEVEQGWRESRIWCPCCGRQRLQGIFVPTSEEGNTSLRMRCPDCSIRGGEMDIINTFGMVSFKGMRSFRPAIKRVLQVTPDFYTQILTTNYLPCPFCNGMTQLRGIEKGILPGPFQHHLCLILECSACSGKISSAIMSLFLSYPSAYQFMTQHERCVIEPELAIEYEGQPAFRVSLTDLLSSAQQTMILHGSTLELLAAFEK